MFLIFYRNLCLDPTVKKVSRCELEVDVIAEDILNQINVESCIGHNPGITAMWEDERQRRRDIGLSSQVPLPVSQGSDDEHDEDIYEDKESILMSQPFWKDDEEEHDSQRLMQTSETFVRTLEQVQAFDSGHH
ncbi:uncharacterized protein LOC124442073 isoform X2 [Xenia sp. Carnegie-2017]|uniref:uncharacterized protein LOC124442073 isoform X2 n=1 Tax=Xenia sp. Carnegie-2017 TaxID=2897299 RepID=UPI001F04EB13|nr:uncharacterized protein LOC124442073 isoform X2 [Xenia sp. Carnegie-2017]